jgi:hypothetical protein
MPDPNNKLQRRGNRCLRQALGQSTLEKGAHHCGDDQILPEARHQDQALEAAFARRIFRTRPFYRGATSPPYAMNGFMTASRLRPCAASCARPCISVRSCGELLYQLRHATFFSSPSFFSKALQSECIATTAYISWSKGPISASTINRQRAAPRRSRHTIPLSSEHYRMS